MYLSTPSRHPGRTNASRVSSTRYSVTRASPWSIVAVPSSRYPSRADTAADLGLPSTYSERATSAPRWSKAKASTAARISVP